MLIAPNEEKMWEKQPIKYSISELDDMYSDVKITTDYLKAKRRILRLSSRKQVPGFLEELKNRSYIDLELFNKIDYCWDIKKQSRLIESILINIPIPPIILFEKTYDSYELIDGKQRILAIRDFYNNKYQLTELEFLSEFEGCTYKQLPIEFRRNLDNHYISSIALLTQSTFEPEEALYLKQITFERSNASRVGLTKQQVRNCLYNGKFNQLLVELSENPIFISAWNTSINNSNGLTKNLHSNEFTELVLRFFALRHINDYSTEIENFLDLYMIKSMKFSDEDIKILRYIFITTINLASKIYEANLFKPYDAQLNTWAHHANQACYDAVMVGLSKHLDNAEAILSQKHKIIEDTKQLFSKGYFKFLENEGNKKAVVQERISLFDDMLSTVIVK
ncbi:hypothetical protein NIES4071_38780 [Calothrix sp. NIES-4071]|nr:hypothetical protein NIES4071_38780 [Calothrix sp. NIES-4071]BAZ58196.1 hypothetical protein NIES4105_38720 [Calothrix sp. NIES-4105]